jgi:hypothetical protein
MKKYNLVIFVALVAAAGFFLWAIWQTFVRPHAAMSQGQSGDSAASATALEAKTASNSGVEIAVQPIDLGSGPWKFTIGLNTHAGSLDMDFLKTVSLTDDRGDTLAPVSWEGPPSGGHHRNGTLTFSAPTVRPHRVTLTIAGGNNITTSTFSWDIP